MEKLSYILIDMGFFSALGTIQEARGGEFRVVKGQPNTWATNNGVMVVCDERGWPWIIRLEDFLDESWRTRNFEEEFGVKRGAHVPHSNDGGRFVREILPKLLNDGLMG